ncbi:uncharacterized protein MKK02DRAFT_21481 [Dioszegia hungarica]|uniref:ATP-dependent DNA ligase family profile domain-containing protein n=1 Tax=Dioszegia hungarica TaxID=4972 RepID=A0AA38LRQ4_9TREE|nr:uncharacterized protein MKK02DRAFT_21481 [Dioszegia hungarica]KAI9631724.1 hypothetical protein MKK02DRAFT_21481 [Dioszegia hungarica]
MLFLLRQGGVSALRPLTRVKQLYTPLLWRSYSAALSTDPVLAQLRRVSELQERVRATNSNAAKQRIIVEYPDLRNLLEQVYHPKFRTHLSSASLDSYLSSPTSKLSTIPPPDIPSLFDTLSTRSATGNAAKELVRAFLVSHGVIGKEGDGGGKGDTAALEVFKRLLDRNLVAGFGARTLSEIQWPVKAEQGASAPQPTAAPGSSVSSAFPGHPSSPSAPPKTSTSRSMDKFSCALGKTILPHQLSSLFSPISPQWFASRKLDGVRVITFLDFFVPTTPGVPPVLKDIAHLSRAGNAFTSLGNLRPQLAPITGYPQLREWLDSDPLAVSAAEEVDGVPGHMKRLVLDGEVCVMRPRTVSDTAPASSSSHPLWSGDSNLVEDFAATVSEIKRGKHTIENPGYHLFDILSWSEFHGTAKAPGRNMFSQRIQELKELGTWLSGELEREGVQNGLKVLEQVQVGGVEEVEGMVQTAAERGWEGLVLRADRPYKGSRSSDVRKFKRWLDGEYTVRDIELSRQRLSIDGVFAEYEAVAALVFHHKRHPVTVSSGLTAEQRVQWAKDPSLIIGRQMTVEYFSESEAAGREGVPSLRFPRIKTIYEGKRDI